ARYLTREQIEDEIAFTSIDVSFISLKIILPAIRPLLKSDGNLVCLIKPQFEAGREKVGKKGVIRDKAVHLEVVSNLSMFFVDNGYSLLGLTFSPVKGPEGNIEYLAFLQRSDTPKTFDSYNPEEVVNTSHRVL
ncbi:MAG: TlyA family RNA methyltransferase, partial [Oscillospiraceae bacterium]